MGVLLLFTFVSGLVTILAPCIWPLLPIILSSTTTGGKRKPLGVTLGIIISFAFFTLTISYLVKIFPIDANHLRLLAVVVIGFLGLTLLIPQLSRLLEGMVSRLTNKLGISLGSSATDEEGNPVNNGFGAGLVTGLSLGIVWSPCAGPILATIATLAATRQVSFQIVLVTLVYVIGVGIPLFIFALAGQKLLTKTRGLSKHTGKIQQVFGVIMILTAIAIYTNYDKTLQIKLLDAFPSYENFLIELESNEEVTEQLDKLRGNGDDRIDDMRSFSPAEMGKLPNHGPAPEIIGINNWLNTDEPLTLEKLRGKVVLIDFWTYTCINCIRTLPHLTTWYEKYKDDNFVLVGVHTPEFEFEKKTENVQNAIQQYNITYPVAQDNDYKTWRNYDNRYWPAHYLIDAEGNIRYVHFGEGKYEETEEAIRELIAEAGMSVDDELSQLEDQTPRWINTPETYLGFARMKNFGSNETPKIGTDTFTAPENLKINQFAFEGTWEIGAEESTAVENATLRINYYASKVFLVITPAQENQGEIMVYLDGELISNENSGTDVENGILQLDVERLYEIVDLGNDREKHELRLEFPDGGISVFAFTFG